MTESLSYPAIATRRSSPISTATMRVRRAERAAFDAHLPRARAAARSSAAFGDVRASLGRMVAAQLPLGRLAELRLGRPVRARDGRRGADRGSSGGATFPRGRRSRRRCCVSASAPASRISTCATTPTAFRSGPAGRRPTGRAASADPVAAASRDAAPWRAELDGARAARFAPSACASRAATAAPRTPRAATANRRRRRCAASARSSTRASDASSASSRCGSPKSSRDVNAQRQADLVKIDRNLGAMQNNTGLEMLQAAQRDAQLRVASARRRRDRSKGG